MSDLNITLKGADQVTPGLYKHFKGKYFRVLNVVGNSGERDIVIYIGNDKLNHPSLFYRYIDDFNNIVCWANTKSGRCTYMEKNPKDTYGFREHNKRNHFSRFVRV